MTIESQTGVDTVLISPQLITDAATVTANLDCRDGAYASIRVNCSAEEGTNATNATLSVLESDDTVVTNFATVVANRSEDLTSAHEVRYEVDMKTRRRYLRLSVTAGTGTGSDATFGAVGTVWRNVRGATSAAAMNASTNDGVVIVSS